MPSIVGAVKINTVAGTLTFGDTLNVAPKSVSKTFSGAGGFSTGDFHIENNLFSVTNTYDADINDANNAFNN
ncbi:spore germination protein PF [Scopulibacillus darangshiensis]|uniref:Spore germination protein PF n=1 Tax=Scopulibacillus darangshiensis TaxID=442528 RepID=A0A4R2PB93_9BACL|nr:spore germination protein [Scopulibacillus darangshiensis]TCP31574.1 spore germination protein PF [Scopulibacillus darangshiensis]